MLTCDRPTDNVLKMTLFLTTYLISVLNPDYHFVTREKMQEGIDKDEFIENAEFSGNMYGTRYVLDIDILSHYP